MISLQQENLWQGKTVLITGVCGTVGQQLLTRVLEKNPQQVIGLDNNESQLFDLAETYHAQKEVRLVLGDVRDRHMMMDRFRKVDYVLHVAAFKHVTLCEESPRNAVLTNILGTQNVIDAALANQVQRVLFTSSDKAVNPTNVMGTSKLMAERLITAAMAQSDKNGTRFASCRFGNILGSRGSVLPLFKRQIAQGRPVTLTDPGMTRFVMTLEQSVKLVMDALFMARSGEVFVTKMQTIRIVDLAEIVIEELAPTFGLRPDQVPLNVIGAKPGEKFYEELLNGEEARRSVELEQFFVILPAFSHLHPTADHFPLYGPPGIATPYDSGSEPPLSKEQLRIFLKENRLLD
ncbi:MAG: polysaccharide biosynthesis protein [Magnetococcus sp. DMHC-6]